MTPDFRALCAELVAWAEKTAAHYYVPPDVLTRARAALAQPESKGPTVMEIIELADEIEAAGLGQVDLVRAALTRWGRPAPQPVPVSERLPGPEDCDEEGRCWLRSKYQPDGPTWRLACLASIGTKALWFHYAEWLPAHDLPLPGEVEVEG